MKKILEKIRSKLRIRTGVGFYCQSGIESRGQCKEQCDHCKEYYKPLENETNVEEDSEEGV